MKLLLIVIMLTSLPTFSKISETWLKKQYNYSLDRILKHTSRADTPKGFIVAAPSKYKPNYYYHWVRDAALVMNALQETLSLKKFTPLAKDYVSLVSHNQRVSKISGQGEPKFNPDGTSFMGPWGRPQNDGPALRVLTLAQFALNLIDNGQIQYVKDHLYNPSLPARTVIKVDLEYTSHHYNDHDYDLWEEIKGQNFYSKMAQRKALLIGMKLARRMKDHDAADWYFSQAQKIDLQLNKFWSSNKGHIESTINRSAGLTKPSRLDASTYLSVLHSGSPKLSFNHTDNRILRTVDHLVAKFKEIYPINKNSKGVAVGRYSEDTYFGGQPWFLLTAGLSEFYYELAAILKNQSSFRVTNMNWHFLNKTLGLSFAVQNLTNDSAIKLIANRLVELGDANLNKIQLHSGAKLQLDEQFDKNTGFVTGAAHLTWSYAAILTAINARNKALK